MSPLPAHLYETRDGRRVHLAACWCWAALEPAPMPAASLLSLRRDDGPPAKPYPEVIAERLAAMSTFPPTAPASPPPAFRRPYRAARGWWR